MSTEPHHPAPMRLEDYLAEEHDGPLRHEYLDGQAYPLPSCGTVHDTIALNIASVLHEALAHPCRVFLRDTKVRVPTQRAEGFYYPDVVVQCQRVDPDAGYLDSPVVVFEVLAPATERVDRHEKRLHYQGLPTLEACVLVHPDTRCLEVDRRVRGWATEACTEGALVLECLGVELPLDAVYRDVEA